MIDQLASLRTSRAKLMLPPVDLRLAAQHTPVGLFTLDRTCHILEANPASEEFAGTALAGRRFCDVFRPHACDQNAGASCPFAFALRGLERRTQPRWTTLQPGTTPQSVLLKVAATPSGAIVTLIPSALLNGADRRRRELVAAAVHDLRLPITVQSLAIELLTTELSSTPEDSDVRMLLSKLQRATSALAISVDDLLSRMMFELNTKQVQPVMMDLLPALETLVWYLQPMLDRRHQSVRLEVPKGLTVRADPAALEQMLVNLILNAHKYSVDGDCFVIAARVRRAINATELQIRDHGPGIPADERRRVFDRFYRGENAGRQVGAGLGLSIVHAIVEQHGGSAGVRAARGGGALFWIQLPDGERSTP